MLSNRIAFCGLMLLVLAAAVRPTAAGTEAAATADLIAAAPDAADFPGSDAVVLLREIDCSVDANGLMTRRVRTVTKLMTDWAVRNLSDVRIDWDSSRQELVINTARAFMRDGAEVPTPENGFNEVTPDAVRKFPAGLDYREMVVSHVGVQIGGVLELDYEIRDLHPGPLPAAGREELAGDWPILREIVRVTAPEASAEAMGAAIPAAATVAVEESDDGSSIAWTLTGVPAMPLDRGEDRRGDLRPSLAFASGYNDWAGLARRLRALAEAAGEPDRDLEKWLDDPRDDGGAAIADLTDLDTLKRIADLVGNRIMTVRPEPRWSRAPRPVGEVFAGLRGTPWEKAILAGTLLAEAGLKAEIGFFGPGAGFPSAAATQFAFEHVRVAVRVGDRNWWIDPDSGEPFPGRCDLVGRTGFFPEDTTRSFRRYLVSGLPGETGLLVDLRPGPDGGMTAEIDFAASGTLWTMDSGRTGADLADELAGGVLRDAEVGDLLVLDWSPTRVHLRFSASGSLPEAENGLVVIELPRPPHSVRDELPRGFRANASTRSADLLVEADLAEKVRLRLTLPPDLAVDHLPAAVEIAGPGCGFELAGSLADGVLTVERSLEVSAGRIPAAEFGGFAGVIAAAGRNDVRTVVLAAASAED